MTSTLTVYPDFQDKTHVITVSRYHKDMAVFTDKRDHRKSYVVNCSISWLEDNFQPIRSHTFHYPSNRPNFFRRTRKNFKPVTK